MRRLKIKEYGKITDELPMTSAMTSDGRLQLRPKLSRLVSVFGLSEKLLRKAKLPNVLFKVKGLRPILSPISKKVKGPDPGLPVSEVYAGRFAHYSGRFACCKFCRRIVRITS